MSFPWCPPELSRSAVYFKFLQSLITIQRTSKLVYWALHFNVIAVWFFIRKMRDFYRVLLCET